MLNDAMVSMAFIVYLFLQKQMAITLARIVQREVAFELEPAVLSINYEIFSLG